MRKVIFISAISAIALGGFYLNQDDKAKCKPTGTCNACKNCKYCKNCSENGGSCSVCRK